jgi:hypothetical protein
VLERLIVRRTITVIERFWSEADGRGPAAPGCRPVAAVPPGRSTLSRQRERQRQRTALKHSPNFSLTLPPR